MKQTENSLSKSVSFEWYALTSISNLSLSKEPQTFVESKRRVVRTYINLN